jgi:cyanophycinase-like exopeptidase
MPGSTDNEIILIGGGVSGVAPYLASKAGGEIGIVTFAMEDQGAEQYISEKTELFAGLACKVRSVKAVYDLEGLALVLYAGGDQNRLASRLKETGIHKELVTWWRKGEVILAGSSAGAMVLCGVMLEESSDDEFGRAGVGLTHGLGPLGASFVVPHWSQWATPEWRAEVTREHGGGYYIFGIDENTGLVWRAGKCRVVGQGGVQAVGRMTGEWRSGEEFEVARGF